MKHFIRRWTAPDYQPASVSEKAIVSAEGQLASVFPKAYRTAILDHGLPSPTIELLDEIVDLESELSDISEFLTPNEIVENTFDWREMGLPVELIAFATDSSGNLFCFPESTSASNPEDSPIMFYDHDFGTTETVATSFAEWIGAYCQLGT